MNVNKMLWGFSGLSFLILLAGCGSAALSPNLAKLPSADKAVVVEVPALQQMESFNTQISHVKDEATAGQAVETFSTHVASAMTGSDLKPQSNQAILSPALSSALAKKEVEARQGLHLHAEDAGFGIPSEKVAQALNEVMPEIASNPIRSDEIEAAKEGVRAELPAMSPDKAKNMTPLEAMVVGYSFVTGDHGEGAEGSGSSPVTQEKIDQFVSHLLEEGKQ